MAVRFLHLADLHLGSRHEYLGEGNESRAREVKETFREAVNFALDPERGIDGILISGNLFDNHCPDPETLSFVRGLLGRVVAAKKPVVLVPGYRDGFGYKDSVYRTERWPGIDVISSPHPGAPIRHTIRDQEVFFYGTAVHPGVSAPDFPGFERYVRSEPEVELAEPEFAEGVIEAEGEDVVLEAADDSRDTDGSAEIVLDEIPETLAVGEAPADTPALIAAHEVDPGLHIGLLCAGLPDHPESGLRPQLQTVDPATLAESGLDYIALGGYHGFATYEFDGTSGAYPGTLEGRRFEVGDYGQKSVLVVDVEEGKVEFTHHAIGARSLEEWTIDLSAERITDPDALCAAILARASERVIARIHLVGPLEFMCDLEDVADKVRDRFHHLDIIDRTDLLGSGLLRRIQGEHTIRGFFVRRMIKLITGLENRTETADIDSSVHRELEVARTALKLGLEQFLDQEPAQQVLFDPPAEKKVAASAAPVPQLGAVVDAPLNGGSSDSSERKKALMRAERETQANEGEGGL